LFTRWRVNVFHAAHADAMRMRRAQGVNLRKVTCPTTPRQVISGRAATAHRHSEVKSSFPTRQLEVCRWQIVSVHDITLSRRALGHCRLRHASETCESQLRKSGRDDKGSGRGDAASARTFSVARSCKVSERVDVWTCTSMCIGFLSGFCSECRDKGHERGPQGRTLPSAVLSVTLSVPARVCVFARPELLPVLAKNCNSAH
jgi:hypothetical protein